VRALRAVGAGRDQLQLLDVAATAEPAAGEVQVATRAVGVCGSDIHVWHGTQTYPMTYPVTLGHELMGVVQRVGPGVSGVAEGQRVVSETARSVCGVCPRCREGHYNLCESRLGFGARYDGGMAESFVTRAPILHAVPDNVTDEVAAATEPYCVAYNAVVERAHLKPAARVAVIGPGPVGVFACQIALIGGAAEVVVTGIPGDEARLLVAKALGASATVIAEEEGWWQTQDLSSAFDLVVDAAGVSATLEAALGLVQPGGQVVKVGWGPEPYGRPLDALVAKAVDLHGAFSHTWSTWERVLRLLGQGRLDPGPALRTYRLEQWEDAFNAMADRHVLKAVLLI